MKTLLPRLPAMLDREHAPRRSFLKGILVAFVALGLSVLACDTLAAVEPGCAPAIRAGDQLWLVSCRGLECGPAPAQAGHMHYWRYDAQRSWTSANLDELTAGEDTLMLTILFAHGNRIDSNEAFTKGWSAYWAVARDSDRPVRFVIFSWPSDTIRGPIVDARTKAWRTNICGYYMAWLVDRLQPEAPLSLLGHSFGARIVTGSLHLLGGGSIDGQRLDQRVHAARRPANVTLLAAALDNDWLLPGHYHGQALSQIGRLLLINNSCDALLMRYRFLYGRRACQQALGYTGLPQWGLAEEVWRRIEQVDACCFVGREHWFHLYIGAGSLVTRMRHILMFEPKAPKAPQETSAAATQAHAIEALAVPLADPLVESSSAAAEQTASDARAADAIAVVE